MLESALASMRNLDTAEALASATDSPCSDCLRFGQTQGTARQRGQPRTANLASMSGATAEKASPLEGVSSSLKTGKIPGCTECSFRGWAGASMRF